MINCDAVEFSQCCSKQVIVPFDAQCIMNISEFKCCIIFPLFSSTALSECLPECINGGQCIGGFCMCQPGYKGAFCEIEGKRNAKKKNIYEY